MDNQEKELDYNLDDIMQQLYEASTQGEETQDAAELTEILTNLEAAQTADEDLFAGADSETVAQASQAFFAAAGEITISGDTDPLPDLPAEPAVSDDTDPLPKLPPELTDPGSADQEPQSGFGAEVDDQDAVDGTAPEADSEPTAQAEAPSLRQAADEPEDGSNTVPLMRSARLRELKRKLVAGPEKRYYALSGQGIGRLQVGIILNFIVLMLCGLGVFLYTRGMVPASRTKLTIYTQVLGMMASGLLGSGLIMDGIGDLFHLCYSMNTTLMVSFIACMADAWFCLDEQRVPFCSAFVLEMTMAMLAQYHRCTTELAQLDTMRKATSLTSLVKEPMFYGKRDGILRGQGDVDDFMDTYARPGAPEVVQQVYALVALLACVGIAVLTGMLHGTSMAVKIFSTSLLVSFPAGYFVALTRPAALLEKRLHMVGAVICGWQGVKKLCGRAVVPLRDKDLFPKGSTKLNGIKFYSDRPSTEVVSYSASLIFAAGGALVPLFRNLLASRSGTEYPVESFRDYGMGGVGGEVNGEPVLLGSLEFLQDMGVEIPQGTMVSQAVYVAVDGQLVAVIAISYARMRSAAAGIVSLCGCRKLKTLLLAGDFMLTDSFIREKFSIRTKRLILPPQEERAELAARRADPEADVLALVTRDDLISSAYAITGAMSLRRASVVGSVVGILGGVTGLVIMLALSYLGSTELLTPARVLLYQLAWMIPSLLATEWTRVV